ALYGTTSNPNLAFRLREDGSHYEIISGLGNDFGDADGPAAPLVETTDGRLFGTSFAGWASFFGQFSQNTYGTIFSLDRDGANVSVFTAPFSVSIFAFGRPSGLLKASDGYLYGTMLWGRGDAI